MPAQPPREAFASRLRVVLQTLGLCTAISLSLQASAQTTPPPLSITQTAPDTLRLAWSDLPPGFVLQYSGQLLKPVLWDGVSQTPGLVGSDRVVTLSMASLGGSRGFFRLVPKGPTAGLDYLIAHQNINGTWGPLGSASFARDTESAAQALAAYGRKVNDSSAYSRGVGALGQFAARNHDELSRRTLAFVGAGKPVANEVTTLLSGQNVASSDATALGYPGRGWGLADGFGNSSLDTALVLRALRASGRNGGLSVASETVAAGATSPAHAFTIPAGSTAPTLRVRNRTAAFRFRLTYPGGGSSTVDVGAGSTPTDVAFPAGTGVLSLTAQNLSGAAGAYAAEVGFTGPDGFDYFRLATALSYLGLKQNADGGWSVLLGEDSHLLVTSEVARTLALFGPTFVSSTAPAVANTWMLARQNGDGGFSNPTGTSNPYETALAMLELRDASPGTSLATASAYLRAAQLPNGSWANDAATTALALQALYLPPVVTTIPNQTVSSPTAFTTVNLDNFVSDPDHADSALTWTATGNTLLTVSLSPARVATITYPAATSLAEDLTFTARDPDGNTSSTTARFTVNYSVADYSIPRGGFATGTRSFTTTPAVISQVAFYTQSISGLPSGYTYNTTAVRLFGSGTVEIDFRIDIAAGAALGVQSFNVTYGLLNSSSAPLGPLTGNNFTFTIQVTP